MAQARSGVAVLMSTHLLSIAEELADTIGIIDHGRMLAQGTLAELRERVQIDGPLEDLFLKLTGGGRPGRQRPVDDRTPEDEPMTPGDRASRASPPVAACRPPRPSATSADHRRAGGAGLPPAPLAAGLATPSASILAGSRLRLTMILVCSAIFWVGAVRPVLRRLPVHRASTTAT